MQSTLQKVFRQSIFTPQSTRRICMIRVPKRSHNMKLSLKICAVIGVSVLLTTISACTKEGCTDSVASNFNKEANKDDGTCKYKEGCMDLESINFDSAASISDGSCMTFKTWEDWILEITKTGIDTNLGVAHFASDSTSTRDVYFLEGQDPTNGKYPEGTMIFKHIRTIDSTQSEYVGMVKQEKDFNKDSQDWEWFVLDAKGKVQTDEEGDIRGGNIFSGYCTNCHLSAATDMVFSK